MASCAATLIKLFNFKSYQLICTNLPRVTTDFNQVRNYAARKGTRERKLKLLRAKKSSKKPEEKITFKKHKEVVERKVLRSMEHKKRSPIDDVVICKYYKLKIYDFAEAIQCHRETHHPTVYNKPEAYVQACIELDMTDAKKNRFVDNFTRLAPISHAFPMGDPRSIIVFCKTKELQEEAKEAGADLVGDSSLIRDIEKGNVSIRDFDHVLAHPNALPDMVPIRGLMKKVYPNPRAGTLGVDVKNMVSKFRNGIKYSAKKDDHEQDYGLIEVNFGTLNMEIQHLQDNLQNVLRDIYSIHPKRPGLFITRVYLRSEPSPEKLKVNLDALLPEQNEEQDMVDSDDEEDEAALTKDKKFMSV